LAKENDNKIEALTIFFAPFIPADLSLEDISMKINMPVKNISKLLKKYKIGTKPKVGGKK
jgi:hypothetical protein